MEGGGGGGNLPASPTHPKFTGMPLPFIVWFRLHDGWSSGVLVSQAQGRLERCELWGNAEGGVYLEWGGDPTLAACTLRDHAAGIYAAGVYVDESAAGKATIGADCVFSRNARGDVVRE